MLARGNQRRTIFRDASGYRRYAELLARYQQRHGFTLYAYVLIPNHLHLLISPTRHFNLRHRLVGHCFQGRYKAILCQSDAYLMELVRYLHLNPVRAGLSPSADRYIWSSHHLYLKSRDAEGVAVESVLRRFSEGRHRAVVAYRAFVEVGLPSGHRKDLYDVIDQRLLGGEHFAERMERKIRQAEPKPPVDVPMQVIARQVARALGIPEIHMGGRGRSRAAALARAVAAHLAREEAGLPINAASRYFGRDEATVSLALQRLENPLATDTHLSARLTLLRRVVRRGARRKRIKQIIKA